MYGEWPIASIFLFCEPINNFHHFISYFSNLSNTMIIRLMTDGWFGLCIGNESEYEWLAIRQWLIHHVPQNKYATTENIFCEIFPSVAANIRIILFEDFEHKIAFYEMLNALPQRVHLAVGSYNVEPADEFKKMLEYLNIGYYTPIANRRVFSFSDTSYSDKIKLLAALSLGTENQST